MKAIPLNEAQKMFSQYPEDEVELALFSLWTMTPRIGRTLGHTNPWFIAMTIDYSQLETKLESLQRSK